MSGLQAGCHYKITNVKNPDCALDLSAADNKSIIGYAYHGGDNQKWELEESEDGWHLKNVASGHYAVIEGDEPENGAKVVADPNPFLWDISDDNGAYRLSVPDAKKSLDLSNHGTGPDVEIWGTWEGENQLWHFEQGTVERVFSRNIWPAHKSLSTLA